jgi:hypothetical protein
MRFLFLLNILIVISFLSCKKDSEKKHCWAIVDNLGSQFSQICNKTEAQISLEYPNSCSYYKVEEQTYCWTLPNGGFVKNASESQMAFYTRCFGQAAATKVDCSFCEKWFSREKRTYKPTSSTTYTVISFKNYCGSDLTSIPPNRQIIRKDDADSLIIVQFSSDGTNW